MSMKVDMIDALTAPKSDPEFGLKYGLTVLCTALSAVIVGAPLLVGYMGQTMKHAGAGKKGLPEWKNFGELAVQGAVCFLSGLYLLPAAVLMVVASLPLMMGGNSFFSLGAMLHRFIMFGALILLLVGLAFSLTGMHSYLQSRQVSDLVNFGGLLAKIKAHTAELGALLTFTGVVVAALSIAVAFTGMLGGLLSLLGGAFLNLVLAWGVGNIYRLDNQEVPAESEAALLEGAPEEVIEMSPAVENDEDIWRPT